MAQLRTKLSESDARTLVNVGKSPRCLELERLQAYYEGKQYEGKEPYLNLSSDTPRLERAPCIIYPLLENAIRSNAALGLGGNRFPRVLSLSSEDDSAFDADFGLDQTSSETLDAFNGKLLDLTNIKGALREAYRKSQAARSCAIVASYKNGIPFLDVLWPANCTPTFDPTAPGVVQSLEVRYRYIDFFRDAVTTGGEWWPVVKEYRRVIDAKTDTVFKPKEIWDKSDIEPTSAVQAQVTHGFGFCPVVWYARGVSTGACASGIDGASLADGKLGELDAINHALSSRHLAAFYTGDPVLCGTGIEADDTLGTTGRAAASQNYTPDKKTGWDKALYDNNGKPRIRKGPGEFWRVESPDAKLFYLTLPAGALDAINDHASDLCSKVREALRYVWIDPEKLTGSGDISGKTLAFVFATQINAVTEDRDDLRDGAIIPVFGTIYRMIVANPKGLRLPGVKKARPILSKFLVEQDNGVLTFIAPQLQFKFGEFFEPSDIDESTRVSTANSALTAKIITKATAVEHVKDVFAIGNVDQYVKALDKEAAENQQAAIQNAAALAGANAAVKPLPGAAQQPNAQNAPKGLQTKKAS